MDNETIWLEFSAEKGKPLKNDILRIAKNQLGLNIDRNGRFYIRFDSKTIAVNFVRSFHTKLNKRYICRILTEKQFSMRKTKNNYNIDFDDPNSSNEIFYI